MATNQKSRTSSSSLGPQSSKNKKSASSQMPRQKTARNAQGRSRGKDSCSYG